MASFSNLSRTYAKDKLSKCVTTVLLVCYYLYRKRSYVNNINAEGKDEVEMQTPIDDSGIFSEVSRSAHAFPNSSLEPLVRNPSQGSSSRSGNSVDSPGPSPRASGSLVCLPASLSRTTPRRLHYQASGQTAVGLVPFGTCWRPHDKRGWCDLARLQAPPMYNNGARKHRVVRGVQTSLNTRPKLRASA